MAFAQRERKEQGSIIKEPVDEIKESERANLYEVSAVQRCMEDIQRNKEFDPGSGRTLAARLTHASRTEQSKTQSVLQLIIDNGQLKESAWADGF